MKDRKKKIEIPIYFGQLIIHQCKDIKAKCAKHGVTLDRAFEAIIFEDPKKKSGYTRYRMVFGHNVTPKMIAHEAMHIVNYIYADRDIKQDIANDEPTAYLIGWIVGECHKFLKVKKQKH